MVGVGDVEAFIEWLRARGTPEPQLEAHRHYARELAKHPSLSAALRAEQEAGAPANRSANIVIRGGTASWEASEHVEFWPDRPRALVRGGDGLDVISLAHPQAPAIRSARRVRDADPDGTSC